MISEIIQRLKKWLNAHKKFVAEGAVIVLLIGAMWIGGGRQEQLPPESETPIQTPVETTVEVQDIPKLPVLDPDQIEILDAVIVYLNDENPGEAAAKLLENEQKLQYVFYQVLKGEQYLYRDGTLSEELEGKGLVLKKPLSIYYGSLQDGVPEGEGICLQGIYLEGMRYDYSQGTWNAGKMQGDGVVGYHYYEGVSGEENVAVQKEGVFVDDLMDGALVYRTTNSEGETSTWNMEAQQGKTKLNESWIQDAENGQYDLPSNENQSHTYVLMQEEVEEVRWRNMIPWSE